MTKKEINEKVEHLERQLINIYNEIMRTEDVSFYRNYTIKEKIILIIYDLKYLADQADFLQKLENIKLFFYKFNSLLSTIISIVLIFNNLFIALLSLLFALYNVVKIIECCKKDPEDIKLAKTLIEMENIITNCDTFINKKIKINELRIINEIEQRNGDIEDFYLANDILESYLNEEKAEIPNNNIKQIIIQILQEDFGTDINDIDTLISMAKEKISYEKLSKDMDLTRKYTKKAAKK